MRCSLRIRRRVDLIGLDCRCHSSRPSGDSASLGSSLRACSSPAAPTISCSIASLFVMLSKLTMLHSSAPLFPVSGAAPTLQVSILVLEEFLKFHTASIAVPCHWKFSAPRSKDSELIRGPKRDYIATILLIFKNYSTCPVLL
ncbi:hypothetical protein B0H19DRAFT_149892 [Mycena capillaripes]|nr:hypothetical protein B0H19DRAFT_149892 [Mycena capillaripes]